MSKITHQDLDKILQEKLDPDKEDKPYPVRDIVKKEQPRPFVGNRDSKKRKRANYHAKQEDDRKIKGGVIGGGSIGSGGAIGREEPGEEESEEEKLVIRWGVLWSIFYCLCLLYLLYLIDEYTVSRTLNNLSYQLEEWPVSSKQEQWRTPRAYPGFLLKESPGEDGSQFMARGTNLPVRGSGATNSNRRLKKTSPSENISKTSTLQGDSTLSGLDLLAEAERMISNHQPSEALLLAESAYYLQPEAQKKEILLILTRGLEKLGICPKAQKVYLERIQKQRKVSSKSDFKPGKSDRIFPQKTARQKEKKSSLRRGRKNNFPTNPQEREQLLKRREQELTKICDKYCKDWKKRKDFNFPP